MTHHQQVSKKSIHSYYTNVFQRSSSQLSGSSHANHREDQHQCLLNGARGGVGGVFGGALEGVRSMVTVTKTSTTSPSSPTVEVVHSQNDSSTTPSPSPSSSPPTPTLSTIQDNNTVTISPSAVQQINHLAKNKNPSNPSNIYLRVYVDAGGCSGFQYKFELEDKDDGEIVDDEDVIFQVSLTESQSDGSKDSLSSAMVVIDEGSLEYIQGSTIDFVREMVRSSFAVVNNPQSESACGCGSSFAVKNFESNPALD